MRKDKSSGLYDLHLSSVQSSSTSSASHKSEGEILSKANIKSFTFNKLRLATRNFISLLLVTLNPDQATVMATSSILIADLKAGSCSYTVKVLILDSKVIL